MIDSILDIAQRFVKTLSIILILICTVVTVALAIRAITRLIQHSLGLL